LQQAGRAAGENSPVTRELLNGRSIADFVAARDEANRNANVGNAEAEKAAAGERAKIITDRNNALAKVLAEVYDAERKNLKTQIIAEIRKIDEARQVGAQQAGGG
jgi:hypothetical protein